VVLNIAGGPPGISANFRSPFPGIIAAVLAQAEENRAARGLKRVTHLLINRAHIRILVDSSRAAPVVLQIVDAPLCVSLRILRFMAVTAFVSRACQRPRR